MKIKIITSVLNYGKTGQDSNYMPAEKFNPKITELLDKVYKTVEELN